MHKEIRKRALVMQINRPYKIYQPNDVLVEISTDEAIKKTNRWYLIDFRLTGVEFLDCFFQIIKRHGRPSCGQIAKKMQVEERMLRYTVFALTGIGIHEWITTYTFRNSCEFLTRTDLPITEIAKRTGFNSISAFTQFFMRMQKLTPGDYRWAYRK